MRHTVPAFLLPFVILPGLALAAPAGPHAWCGTARDGSRAAVLAHAEERARRERAGKADLRATAASSFDVGQIAVLLDEGDLALLRNPMDLAGAAIRFTPAGSGYSAARISLPVEPDTGTKLPLGDDASSRIALSFGFPFYGQTYSAAFVNSDGNVTFGASDEASTSRDIGRLVNGPPRAAPLLADLNPETGGAISVQDLRDHVTVTWRAIPQFDKTDRNTFQVSLWSDGRIDFVYDAELSAIEEGVTGIAPGGGRGGVTPVDFASAGAATGTGALAESFRDRDGLDTVAVARKFYATHGDDYQGLVIYTSRRLVPAGTFAYEQTVHNTDAGIGASQADLSREYGSAGRLESFVTMDQIGKYPDDLNQRFLGEDSALSVLAHEVGHRWLANARFRDGATTSTELLGRDDVHWSFFFDSDGSFMEGNDIATQADGRFRTAGASLRYSALDQYLMGLRDASEVPPVFFVRTPSGVDNDPGREPQTGVTFAGTRKDVTIGDMIAAMGDRNPRGAPASRPFREAFVFVAVGGSADAAAIAKVERIRAAWPAFFAQGVEGRGSVDPTLN